MDPRLRGGDGLPIEAAMLYYESDSQADLILATKNFAALTYYGDGYGRRTAI